MEIADIKRRVVETIDRARREASDRRVRAADVARDYGVFLDQRAVPIFKQVANVLRAEGFAVTVFTPAGSVRLASDRTAEDYVELTLDTGGDEPTVTGHLSRMRGRQIAESETALGSPAALGEEEILSFVLKGLQPIVER
jgi:hypothetical protein